MHSNFSITVKLVFQRTKHKDRPYKMAGLFRSPQVVIKKARDLSRAIQ